MRYRAITVQALALLLAGTLDPAILPAQGSAASPAPAICRDAPCVVIFDWGSGRSAADYGPDRKYGSADEFENKVRSVMTEARLRLTTTAGAGAATVTLRPTMRPKSMCDAMAGTNTDFSCTAMSDLQVTFTSGDPANKAPAAIRVSNRCGGDVYMTMSTFGQYAAEMIIFALDGPQTKLKRPSAHC